MTSSGNYSEVNVRPRRYRGIRSSKKIVLYSDYNTEEETKNGSLGQRSISLTALPHNGSNSVSAATTPVPTSPGPLLEPRMAQLETLEAKMASIEVSLSTAQRRKMGKKNGGQVVISTVGKTAPSLGGTSPASIFASIRSNTLVDTCRELEVLRNALKDKENTIQNLQGQINSGGRLTASLQPLDPAERRSAELRLQTLKQEEESLKSAIKKINLTLEEMDDDEANIDVRIKQAELEYELGREELGLLGVREELRMLQARLDAKPTLTLYSSVKSCGKFTLHCVQVEYDPKSPRFGAGSVDDKIGLFVLWAGENSGMQKGDRILEVNGKLTLSTSKEEMIRLLSVCPSKAEIVLLRTWTPPSTEDFLRRENLRLTHRISYLEDQVSELLKSIPNAEMKKCDDKQTEIFQKGSHVALLSTGSMSGGIKSVNHSGFANKTSGDSASETCQDQDVPDNGIGNVARNRDNGIGNATNGYHQKPLGSGQKYHEFETSYPSKIPNASEKIRNLTRKYESDDISSALARRRWRKNSETVEECHQNHALSDLEKSSRKTDRHHHHHHHHHPPHSHNQNRLIDYSSETSCFNYKSSRDRKMETDEESIHRKSEQENDRQMKKPIPPKKPLRLSINRATSLQNVDSGYSIQSAVRKIKRSHKGEAPPPPFLKDDKINGNNDSFSDSNNSRNVSKVESWKCPSDSGQSNFCWPPNIHHHIKTDEKWC